MIELNQANKDKLVLIMYIGSAISLRRGFHKRIFASHEKDHLRKRNPSLHYDAWKASDSKLITDKWAALVVSTRWKWCWVLPTRSRIPSIWKRSSSTCGSFLKDARKSARSDALLPPPTRFQQGISGASHSVANIFRRTLLISRKYREIRLLSAVEPRTTETSIEVHIV